MLVLSLVILRISFRLVLFRGSLRNGWGTIQETTPKDAKIRELPPAFCLLPSAFRLLPSAFRYLIPTTIESGPIKCSTLVSRKPASFIQAVQSCPV